MDFSDTTVVIPAKDEPAIYKVANDVLVSLKNCKVIVLYNGYNGKKVRFSNNRIASYPAPLGKGRAIMHLSKKGFVKTPIMCFIDGDATYEPRNLKKMVEMVRGGYDMVLGNRMAKLTRESMPMSIETGNKIITIVANVLYGMHLYDSQTGLRAMKTSAFESLELTEPEFGIETEMNIKMKKTGYKIGEVAADYYPRIGESKQMKIKGGIEHVIRDFHFLFYDPKK